MTITSLDDDLMPATPMLGFGTKKIIAEYKGVFLYLLDGVFYIPPEGEHRYSPRPIYGASDKAGDWAVSRNIRYIIEWIDELG